MNTVSHTGLVDAHAYSVTGVTEVTRAKGQLPPYIPHASIYIVVLETSAMLFFENKGISLCATGDVRDMSEEVNTSLLSASPRTLEINRLITQLGRSY